MAKDQVVADKCEHCGSRIKEHSVIWLTTKPDYPGRPVEDDGPEWGVRRLWVRSDLAGIICNQCWSTGRRFKQKGSEWSEKGSNA